MIIRITSKVEGFRRAGIAHSKAPKEYADDAFTPEQLKALQAETTLIVEIVGGEDKPKLPTVKERAEKLKAATTLDELISFSAGEDNEGLLKLIEKRKVELAPKES